MKNCPRPVKIEKILLIKSLTILDFINVMLVLVQDSRKTETHLCIAISLCDSS